MSDTPDTPSILPAISPEEWTAELTSGTPLDDRLQWACDEAGILDPVSRHALAALCLHGQPFGFTHEESPRPRMARARQNPRSAPSLRSRSMSDSRQLVEERIRDLLACWQGPPPQRIVLPPALHRALWLECTADPDGRYDRGVKIKYAGIPVEADVTCPPASIYACDAPPSPRDAAPPP